MRLEQKEFPEAEAVAAAVEADSADFGSKHFGTLADRPERALTFEDLAHALQVVRAPLDVPAGHISFLCTLIGLLEPRRMVALGVGEREAFLAACEAAKRLRLESEAVIIDGWMGDPGIGFHEERARRSFRDSLADSYGGRAGYICKYFHDAVLGFALESVDLLYIDGFRSANAVRHDFDSWTARLSRRGAVLLRETKEFRTDFGVWRFWRRVRERYPHIEFDQDQGLALVAVGEEGPLRRLVEGAPAWVASPGAGDTWAAPFEGLGRMSWGLGLPSADRQTPGLSKKEQAADEALAEELQQELQRAKAELDRRRKEIIARDQHIRHLEETISACKRSRSWRVTRPLRALEKIMSRAG